MKIRIEETKEIKCLDIDSDIIGNAGAMNDGQFSFENDEDQDNEIYTADQETFDWWTEYVDNSEKSEEMIEELAETLDELESEGKIELPDGESGNSFVRKRICIEMNCDMEDEHGVVCSVINDIKEEYYIDCTMG